MDRGLNILNEIEKQIDIGVSGKRLLLETAARTTAMSVNTTDQTANNIDRYIELAGKLEVEYPQLKVLGGAMKAFAGAVLNIISSAISSVFNLEKIDRFSKVYSSGVATMQTGSSEGVDSRKKLEQMMREQLNEMRKEPDSVVISPKI